MKNALVLFAALLLSAPAYAQEFGALIGVHQTDADADTSGVSTDGKLNFKAGLAARFELMPNSWFRTGVLYNQRHFDASVPGVDGEVNFDYLDIPALYQYNVNEMFGLFGGLVVAVNINDDVKPSGGADPDAETLVPLISLGASLMFDDMIGFDFYYERGLGGFSEGFENFSTFGANFLYWF